MKSERIKTKYLVWIGGVCNEFDCFHDAIIDQFEWQEKGYDDVVIQPVKYKSNVQNYFLLQT